MIPKISKLIKKIGNWGNTEAIDDYKGDLNDIVQTGFIMATTDTTNTPYKGRWYILTFVKNPTYYIYQIAFSRDNANVIYTRKKETEWSNWSPIKQNITTGTEFETGRTIDGKKEYGKRINCGNIPNATAKTISTGLSNVTYLDYKGVAVLNQYSYKMDNKKINDYSICLAVENNQVKITTYISNYSQYIGYVEIYYTKK